MRQLTTFGKKVMAIAAIVIAAVVILTLGFFILGDHADRLHINQQAFNVLAILCVLPICCIVIAHFICFIRDSRLA